ncbi:hypothetical protein HanIR_Chr02g0083991 [Helianthus annuus]|nr:hypothetical protein HanIR_Chr02g0083991 [Helianthus annuus]
MVVTREIISVRWCRIQGVVLVIRCQIQGAVPVVTGAVPVVIISVIRAPTN